ncbi:MAG: ABC transporter permease [Euryarchaeota archaeon]|nr:ABC transporter permease [Euryarchaeota archaeon]
MPDDSTLVLVRLATRTSTKAVATAFGIGLCVMFLSGSLALLDGLRIGTDAVAERFDEGPFLVYDRVPLEEGRVDAATLASLQGASAAVRVVPIRVYVGDDLLQQTFAATVSDGSLLRTSLAALGDADIWVGESLLASDRARAAGVALGTAINVTSSATTMQLTIERVHPRTALPDDWVLVSEGTFETLAPAFGDGATFVLVEENSQDLPKLREAGFTAVPTAAAVEFLRQGVDGLAPLLFGLVLAAGVVILVLASTFAALEVRYRERELRTMRQLGARPRVLFALVLLQTTYVAGFGTLLGLALASLVTNGVTSFAPLVGLSSFALPQPSLPSLLYPALAAIVAGLLGGLIPAMRAAQVPLVPEGSERS